MSAFNFVESTFQKAMSQKKATKNFDSPSQIFKRGQPIWFFDYLFN